MFHANGNQKKAGVAILVSDKIDFKRKTLKKGKGGHYIKTKGSIQQEDMIIINIYVPNIVIPKRIKKLLKDEINSNAITVGNLIPHSQQWIDHPGWKLIKKLALNNTLDQTKL